MPSAKNYCFTLNNPTDDDTQLLADLAVDDIRIGKCVAYVVYQLEAGENGTQHYQGYIQFTKRSTLATAKRIVGLRAHLEVARGTPKDNEQYCTKEPRLSDPVRFGTIISTQGKRSDISEFVADAKNRKLTERELIDEHPDILAKYPGFVRRVTTLYSHQEDQTLVPRSGWQADLSSILSQDPDDRKVYWYYDAAGNSGKSYFARRWKDGSDNRGYTITGGRHSDIYFGYGRQRVVFFDWARDSQDQFPYVVLENFKNGYFLNTKYETFANYFDVPHVIIFANFLPDQSKLSLDRWIINTI